MSCSATGSQRFLAFPDIPEDHVLFSGAVVFPGCFDLQGCPLVLFPTAEQFKLNTVVKRDDLSRFINYALYLHNKHQRNLCKVSVVLDLRLTALKTVRFIVETLLEIQSSTETISAMYIIQPKKKYVKKHFIKSLSKTSRRSQLTSPKCIFVNSFYELFNYIDRSQLTADFGGYLVYCHRNWALFVKEIDKFVREFFAVVNRLPSCVTELQALSLQSLPAAINLEEFFFKNEDKCSELRRELGLDDLLIHCEHIVEKLKFPDRDPCFQSVAGTVLFSHVAFEMIENYDRITLAVQKLELLWQLVLCRIQIPLKNFQHKSEVEQIMEHITKFIVEKVNVYKVLIASDKKEAEIIKTEFEESIYLPAMELIHCAEEVSRQHAPLKRLAEGTFTGLEDSCCDSLKAIKERFHMAVDLPYSTLKAVCNFHTLLNKVKHWLNLVFNQDFFQDLIRNSYSLRLGSPACNISLSSVWQQEVQSFLRRSSVPAVDELVNLANIANNIPDPSLQLTAKELSHHCFTIRKLLVSPESVSWNDLVMTLAWQDQLAKSLVPRLNSNGFRYVSVKSEKDEKEKHLAPASGVNGSVDIACQNLVEAEKCKPNTAQGLSCQEVLSISLKSSSLGNLMATIKPPSLSSFDSGIDAVGSYHLDSGMRRESFEMLNKTQWAKDVFKTIKSQDIEILEEDSASVSDSEKHLPDSSCNSGRNNPCGNRHFPKTARNAFNFEVKIARSASLPKNPWLSLPLEELESSYSVSITPKKVPGEVKQHSNSEEGRDSSLNCHWQTVSCEKRKNRRTRSVEVQACCLDFSKESESKDTAIQTEGKVEFLEDQRILENSVPLSPIKNILSSTLNDIQEKSDYAADSSALLWDSYDLHSSRNQEESASERYSAEVEYLFSEWEQKEKDHLQSVERLLVQASQILDEEENVLEQEEMLDFLVKTQSTGKHWEIWSESYIGGEETNQVPLSTSELLQAGVLLLDSPSTIHDLDTVSCSSHSSALKANCSSSDNKFQEEKNEPSFGKVNDICTPSNIPCVLKELKELYVIERKILEENAKIHELQHLEKCNQIDVQCSKEMVQNMRKERALFFMDLEKEQGIENLDEPLAKESNLTHKMSSMPCDFNRNSIFNKYCEGTIADLESTKLTIHSSLCEVVGTSPSISQRCCRSSLALTDSTVTLDQDPLESAVASLSHESCVVHDQNSNLTNVNCDWTKREEMQYGHTVSLVDAERLSEVTSFTKESRMICMQESPTKVPCNLLKNINKNDASWNTEKKCNLETCGTSPLLVSFETPHAQVPDPGDMEVLSPVPKPRKLSLPCKNEPNGNLKKDVCNEGEKKESCMFLNKLASKQSPKPTERLKVVPENSDFERLTERSPTKRLLPHLKNCDINDVCEAFRTVFVEASNAKVLQKPNPCSVQSIQCSFTENCDALSPARNGKMEHITSVEVSDFGIEVAVGKIFAIQSNASEFPFGFVRKYEEDPLPTVGTIFDHCLIKVDDFNTPIVLDTGSGLVKAGFADQNRPAIVFPSVIGQPKYEEVMNGTLERETYIGHDAQHMRGVLTLKYPVQNGVIKNWNDIENIWQHTFHQLGVNTEDHPVLLTEAAMNPSENRRRMVEIMFESFNVPFTYVAVQAVLALYGTGRTTGVVFDSGDGVSHSVPVYEGYSIPYATQRFNLAGQDITQNLKRLLQERGFSFRTTAEQEIVREIKEACCYVAQDYEAELGEDERSAGTEMYYTLPDGQIISINKERFRAPEILFKPELIGRDHYGIHESIFRSILRCDMDLRQSFVNNIILSGGSTLFPGLPHRLQDEIQSMVPACLSDLVRVSSPKDRDFAVWIGGAVLANLPSFRSAWISREEYDENGANIVFRKCF
ncbi:uncharacterized protein LOC120525628 isoform X1 [Polypterus senegalus]|uniref:uncharacterized protein LOC120525628 isoform X1 n=2 Tax=Polypterus senegalus TaxID=55291 RepID=UPI001962879C|nr:uncharacterized protein LOC120525628 isoform X1 [Polypterus senegalus]